MTLDRQQILICFSDEFIKISLLSGTISLGLVEEEFNWLLMGPHVYAPSKALSPTYFEKAGYSRTPGHLILVPDGLKRIVCLGTSDKFSILKLPKPSMTVVDYSTLEIWRGSVDYPYPEAYDELRRIYERTS